MIKEPWWKLTGQKLGDAVFQTAEALYQKDGPRRDQYLRNSRMYAGRDIKSLAGLHTARERGPGHDPTHNYVGALVDATQSRLAKSPPKPSYLTDDGSYPMQRAARERERFISGILYQSEFYDRYAHCVADMLVLGDLVWSVVTEAHDDGKKKEGRVKVERVYPWELLVDPIDSYYSDPRCMYRRRTMDRWQFAELFPDAAEDIKRAPAAKPEQDMAMVDGVSDRILVVEAWHLPSGPSAKDGRHVVAIEGKLIDEEGWTHERHPFVKASWIRPRVGYWGQSLVERVESLQMEHNEMTIKVQQALWHHATPKVIADRGANINWSVVDNDSRGCVIEKDPGTELQWVAPSVVSPEVFSERSSIRNAMFEVTGVSELTATGAKPAGLSSGKAFLVYNDIESEIFLPKQKGIDSAIIGLAKRIEDAAARLSEAGYEIETVSEAKKGRGVFMKRIKWEDVANSANDFWIKIHPASLLADTPHGRAEQVEMYLQSGLFTPEEMQELMDFPDTAPIIRRKLAQRDAILDQIDTIMDGELERAETLAPEPFQDIGMTISLAQQEYVRYSTAQAEPERLEALRAYIDNAIDLEAKLNPPQPPPVEGPPAAEGEPEPLPEDIPPEMLQ